MRPLVWFRSDLRLSDNPALFHAARDATRGVVGVFVVCPGQWRAHDWGWMKADFVLRSVRDLSISLRDRGIGLVVRTADTFADVPGALLDVAKAHACDVVCFNREYEVNEHRRDEAVTRAIEHAGLRVRAFHDQTLIEPGLVRTGEGRWYTVFTLFRRAMMTRLREHGVPGVLAPPKKQPQPVCDSDEAPTSLAGFAGTTREDLWPAGESQALSRLRTFARGMMVGYHSQRDLPAMRGTSELSPYLAVGAVSARQCLSAAIEAAEGRLPDVTLPVERQSHSGPSVWISELIWREFYRHLLVGFPRLSMGRAFVRWTERVAWRDDPASVDAWREGRVGVPIVDAAMRQLSRTGWMHNRCRMIVAMYLSKHLLIDWRQGERHFMRSLVDGDLANNNGGWQWAASTGTDAAPYFRIFNPVSQSRRFDPHGGYIRRFVPELAGLDDAEIHDPSPLARAISGYPPAIVDHAMAVARAKAAFESAKP